MERGGGTFREIEMEEVKRVIGKLRKGRAAEAIGITNELWKYGGEGVKAAIWRILNEIWKGEGVPEEWEEGIIVPIKKKGKGLKVQDYRGVTLMPTLYKICWSVSGEAGERNRGEKNVTGKSNRF